MRRYTYYICFCLLSILFSERIDFGLIKNNSIDEASGIAASKQNNIIWTHNDSGGKSRIYAVGRDGSDLGFIKLAGAIAIDWEDMSIGPGPEENQDYLYIADIGDNFSKRKIKKIYRFKEPIINLDSTATPFKIIIKDYDTIKFHYPDGKRDAESVMIDQRSGELYVVSKRDSTPHIYHINPNSEDDVAEATLIGKIELNNDGGYSRLNQIVAADISRDNTMILFKTYSSVILIKKEYIETISDAIQYKQINLPYSPEPLGESICWDPLGLGYYTLSEELNSIPTHLYYYNLNFK